MPGYIISVLGGKGGVGKTQFAANLAIAFGQESRSKTLLLDFGFNLSGCLLFDLKIVEPRPALVPLTFDAQSWEPFVPLSGISLEVDIETGAKKDKAVFREDLLFTHRGLSGPAVLQISSFWQSGQAIRVNLLPEVDLGQELVDAKTNTKKNFDRTRQKLHKGAVW